MEPSGPTMGRLSCWGLREIFSIIWVLSGSFSRSDPIRTPIFDWYVVWWGLKNKHDKGHCSKEIGLRLHILITAVHSVVNTIGRIYVSN